MYVKKRKCRDVYVLILRYIYKEIHVYIYLIILK